MSDTALVEVARGVSVRPDRARKYVERFLADAHANGHRGPVLLRRWAMVRNSDSRRRDGGVTEWVLAEAIRLESEIADGLAGVES